ncbi:DUF6480 family protein [Streptomyces sp. P6-2-1]|uniref:DUF6480 family protein n=1 Tax=unclassified Streptomyces TaxID=2593676 RepID=UPI003D367422
MSTYATPVSNTDADPSFTTGLEPGGGVPLGETPPAESSTSEPGPWKDPARGWTAAPLIAVGVLVLFFAAFFLAYAVLIA